MKKTILATFAVLAMGGTAMAGSLTDIDQLGNGNAASALQVGGNGNETHVLQVIDDNSSITKQDGSDNYIRVRQYTSDNEVGNDGDNTALTQAGKENKAYVDQKGGNHNKVRKATQDGNRNILSVAQNGARNVVRETVQDGNDNTLAITQATYRNLVTKAASYGNGNAVTIKQSGTWNGRGNDLDGTISGMSTSEANFGLHGSDRQASTVIQHGNSNVANITETGFGQAFEIYQGFSGNTSTGSTVNLAQSNAVNYAYAQQTGSNHTANITQSGQLNRTFVKQDN